MVGVEAYHDGRLQWCSNSQGIVQVLLQFYVLPHSNAGWLLLVGSTEGQQDQAGPRGEPSRRRFRVTGTSFCNWPIVPLVCGQCFRECFGLFLFEPNDSLISIHIQDCNIALVNLSSQQLF